MIQIIVVTKTVNGNFDQFGKKPLIPKKMSLIS